jgi:hypothetical protein
VGKATSQRMQWVTEGGLIKVQSAQTRASLGCLTLFASWLPGASSRLVIAGGSVGGAGFVGGMDFLGGAVLVRPPDLAQDTGLTGESVVGVGFLGSSTRGDGSGRVVGCEDGAPGDNLFLFRKKSEKPTLFRTGAVVSPPRFLGTSFFLVNILSPSPGFDTGLTGPLAGFFGCPLSAVFSSIV